MARFQIAGLDPAPFLPLFELDDVALSALGAERRTVDARPGYPCRISLEDAPLGEEVLLLPYRHLDEDTPFRASGPIYVRRTARREVLAPGEITGYVRNRSISLRAYDRRHRMVTAEVREGDDAASALERLLDNDTIDYVHLHHAMRGCFLCRAGRWPAGS